jgi:hypothetical protein
MSLYQAKRQFEENLRLFGNAQTDPEKFNLYAGLINVTKALSDMEDKLENIEREVRRR